MLLKRIIQKTRLRAFAWRYGVQIEDNDPPRVIHYSTRKVDPTAKYALLAYLSVPIIENMAGIKARAFSNYGLAVSWANALVQLGYVVDIINWDDTAFVPRRKYDLFVAHGAKNFSAIYQKMPTKIRTIYFSTGSYWRFHNTEEKKRFKYFEDRHSRTLPFDRYIYESEEAANKTADGIICLGNQALVDTYKSFNNVYALPTGSFAESKSLPQKDFIKARKNFLFFSGGGNVHKGLDLLIDAFSNSDLHLYIATRLDPEFEKFYHHQLYSTNNIHYEGFVSIGSDRFYQLINECGFVILPSSSEGSPGSVVDCMQRGLIPIVTTNAHLDVEPFGYTIKTVSVDGIRDLVIKVSRLGPDRLLPQSTASKQTALTRHSVTKFEDRLKHYISTITEGNK